MLERDLRRRSRRGSAAGDERDRRHERRDRARDARDGARRRARRAIAELQAASAVGQGKLYRVYDELLRERGVDQRAGAADVLRHERAHALPQRAPDAAPAARLARRAGHQRERHDRDRRDLLRRQRLPRRAGRDPRRRRPADPADRHRRAATPPTRATDPAPSSSREVDGLARLEALEIGHATSPLGSGGMRSKVVAAEMATAAGIPAVDLQRPAPRRAAARAGGRAARARASPRSEARYSLLQAVAALRQAGARARCVVDAGAARALREGGTSLLPVGIVEVRGRVRRRRRRRDRTVADGERRCSARASATTPPPSCAACRG